MIRYCSVKIIHSRHTIDSYELLGRLSEFGSIEKVVSDDDVLHCEMTPSDDWKKSEPEDLESVIISTLKAFFVVRDIDGIPIEVKAESIREVVVGTEVHSKLYGGRNGVVFHIEGDASPESIEDLGIVTRGGRASYDIVFDNGSISRMLPEAILRGVQWRIYATVLDEEKIKQMLEHADQVQRAEMKEQKASDAAFLKRVETLRADPELSYLQQIDAGSYGNSTFVAKNIRLMLKKTFPGVKFSVRKDGSAIYVSWTDGPQDSSVDACVGSFKGGSFNGMDDIYEYSKSPFTQVFGSSQYIFTRREISDEVLARAIEKVWAQWMGTAEGMPSPEEFNYGKSPFIDNAGRYFNELVWASPFLKVDL
ncbi:MAG: hypothetical protein EOP06_02015 [Proteobacteria bacterium]|nr:MAG: hypothetical protein EOP06_02015 [Pseudomonadota bacterium]